MEAARTPFCLICAVKVALVAAGFACLMAASWIYAPEGYHPSHDRDSWHLKARAAPPVQVAPASRG